MARRIKTAAAVVAIVLAVIVLVRVIADARSEGARADSMAESMAPSWAPAVPVEEARRLLAELRVAERGSLTSYAREKFRHWVDQGGRCNTREVVLQRDGEGVTVGADCYPTSGSWTSPYDGETWTKASDVDIEHVVPLAHAWVTGARSWTPAQREAFANDLTRPQLYAVTDNVNQAKSDQAPDEWMPPLESAWCIYGTNFVAVKHFYALSITAPERAALSSMLDRC